MFVGATDCSEGTFRCMILLNLLSNLARSELLPFQRCGNRGLGRVTWWPNYLVIEPKFGLRFEV